jgi:hypothetical protein
LFLNTSFRVNGTPYPQKLQMLSANKSDKEMNRDMNVKRTHAISEMACHVLAIEWVIHQ